jgi:hypothetical protein|tara:strand:- start:1124 stop:2176 length:1053 start_codon:yes stop_codon:yes gene_type:complete
MKKIVILLLIVGSVLFAQDDFFEPGYSVGGYGELHYNRTQKGNEDATTKLDFHRFIIYYGYSFSEQWSFKSEVELEHNFVKDNDGELELEQAFVNYHTDAFGFQAGVILPSVGIINEYHEPPLFVSVERPEYNKYVIPTTWFGNGAAVYGSLSEINWRFALMEDMEGEGIGAGIEGGRGKGHNTTAYSWLKNFSVHYTGFPGLRAGGSFAMNDAPIDDNPDSTVSFSLVEFNAKYDADNIYTVLEYGNIAYENNPAGYTSSGGFYLDLGYNISDMLGLDGKLMPWYRYSDYNRGETDGTVDPNQHHTIQRFGLTYWPISNIAFKFDFGTRKKESDADAKTQINLGVGYNF